MTFLSQSFLTNEDKKARVKLYAELERRVVKEKKDRPCTKHGLSFSNPNVPEAKYLNLRPCPLCGFWQRKGENEIQSNRTNQKT